MDKLKVLEKENSFITSFLLRWTGSLISYTASYYANANVFMIFN